MKNFKINYYFDPPISERIENKARHLYDVGTKILFIKNLTPDAQSIAIG